MILNLFFNQKKKAKIKSSDLTETAVRSVVKSISWRLIGTIDTIVISWIITGQVSLAFIIGSVEFMTKMILYFIHERIWNNIKWGKK